MKQSVYSVALLAILTLSCTNPLEEESRFGEVGTEVEFGAAGGYQNGEETRTIYSGSLYGTSPRYERIDWVAGEDDMTIFYNKQSGTTGTYVVTYVEGNSDENSWAHVEATSGKLLWGTGSDHVFYAMYPANGTTNSLTSAGQVTGMIPATQDIDATRYDSTHGKYLPDMDYAYMVAYAGDGQISAGHVDLPFTPAMTAFEFRLQRRSGDTDAVKLTKFELVSASAPLTGTFAFDITGGDSRGATWNKAVENGGTALTGTGTTITVNFPTGGVSLPENGGAAYLDFTVFALPVELSGLTVRLTFNDGSKLAIPLNDNSTDTHTFAPCKKHIITNTDVPDQEWTYVLGDLAAITKDYQGGEGALNGTFVSYRYKTTTGGTVRKEKVAYTLEYYDEDSSQWVEGLPSWLTKTSGDQTGSTDGTPLKLSVTAQTNTVVTNEYGIIQDQHTLNLKNGTPKGTVSNNYHDLSTYNVATGHTISGVGASANCYVVDAPGKYKFQTVYGNSKNSAYPATGNLHPNSADIDYLDMPSYLGIGFTTDLGHYNWLYAGSNNQDTAHYLSYLKDHNGNDIGSTGVITDPYIVTHLNKSGTKWGAKILWMDSPGLVTDVHLGGSMNDVYLYFEVPSTHICQGNALVAITADDVIVWSWHIWVTDEDLIQNKKTFAKPTYESGYYTGAAYNDPDHPELYQKDYYYAPVNIGWCDGKVEENYAYRSCRIRAKQTGSPLTKEAIVTQTGRRVATRGDSPYYQYGRKDPFLPSQVCRVTETETSQGVYSSVSESWVSKPLYPTGTAYSYNHASANSGSFKNDIINPHILYSNVPLYYNLWNTAAYPSGVSGQNEFVHKSLYDPSPIGYKIGPRAAYAGFTTSNFTLTAANGTTPAGRTYTNGLFFPAIGYLNNTDRTLTGYGSCYYRSGLYNYSLFFDSSSVNVSQTGFTASHAGPIRPIKQYPNYPF